MISAAHSWQLSVRPPAGDLLLENRSLDFSRYFTHLKSQEPSTDKVLLLTAILADAINLCLTKMPEACPGSTVTQLSWLS